MIPAVVQSAQYIFVQETMDTIRYIIAVMLITAIPAAIAFWLMIHPLARFWRRVGPKMAYGVVGTATIAVMAGMVVLRSRILAVDRGTFWPGAIAGIILLAVSGKMLRELRKQLSVRTLIGIPELTTDNDSAPPITTGVYARVRHPRYLQMTVALLGYALIADYPAVYAAFLFWCGGIYIVMLLEERELAARFGAAYADYCRRVPRIIPGRRFRYTATR